MKKMKLLFSLSAVMLSLTAFSMSSPLKPLSKEETISSLIRNASFDGKIDYEELKTIVTEIKGSKLNLGEKVALKLNQKKISKNLSTVIYSADGKSQMTAAMLSFFLGSLGVHRFYLGYTWQGIVQVVTLGGLGVWSTIDFIRILTGSLQPKDGEYGKTIGGN
jgi:TM2 domain-containing membrane protein YozV